MLRVFYARAGLFLHLFLFGRVARLIKLKIDNQKFSEQLFLTDADLEE